MAPNREELDFGMKCIKYMLFVSNFMFVIVGMLLISIGYTVKAIYSNFDEFMQNNYYDPANLAVVIGFFILIIATFGCVGAAKESTMLVNIYAFFLTIVLILQIGTTIAAYAMRSDIEYYVFYNMQHSMENYNVPYNAFAWNATQYNLECCGIYNYSEWNVYRDVEGFNLTAVEITNDTTKYMPTTCCREEDCSFVSNVYTNGCLPRLTYIVSQCALLLGVGALCVSFIQVLGIVFASMLAKSIRKVKSQRLVDQEERRREFYDQMVRNFEEQPKSQGIYTPKDSEA